MGEHRLDLRTPRANAQRTQRIGILGPLEPATQHQAALALHRRARLQQAQAQTAGLAETADQLQVDLAPAGDGPAIHRQHFRPGDHAGLLGQAARRDAADDRPHLLTAEHGENPEEQQGQQEIGDRPGRHYGEALLDTLAVERLFEQRRRYVALALVEHLHVAAQGNGRDDEFGAVTVMPAQQRRAEAHREAQHLDPAAACHPEVAELVKGDQHAQCNQGADNHVQRAHRETSGLNARSGPASPARRRAPAHRPAARRPAVGPR
ncbi:hypothetical protein D3C78_462310 [compost metagenome]